jgi:copper resistance protein B
MKRMIFLALLTGLPAMPAVAQDPHAGHVMPPPKPPAEQTGTGAAQPVGNAPPPAYIIDSAVDRIYGTTPMDRARGILADEHGGATISKFMANILEYADVDDGSGYRWDLEAWYGGDIHRFVFKTEGEGVGSDGATIAETQALYSRAVGRYTDVQAGVRYDLEPEGRAYATVSVESLLPYWFEVEAAAFLSDRGDAFGRLEASHDLRFTQRLILQPRVELELAAQDVPESSIGSGFSSAELGLRLRYDVRREFAPYVGVNFEWLLGQTAEFARAAGADDEEASFVMGLRAWF